MNIKLLSREEIVANWSYLQSQFQKAMDHGQGESTTIDYLQKLLNYQAQAWVIVSKDPIHDGFRGAGLTEILNYNQHKTLHIILFTGDESAVNPEIIDVVEQFGKNNGCVALEQWGRKGWAKMLPKQIPGFYEAYTVMRKDIDMLEKNNE